MKATPRGLLGLAIAFAAGLAYFTFSTRYEALRALTWPNWVVLAFGVALTLRAVFRPPKNSGRLDRTGAAFCAVFALAVAAAFGWYTLDLSRQLPSPPAEKIALGRALPDVTLTTSEGKPFALLRESQSGVLKDRTLLLLFFRGTW